MTKTENIDCNGRSVDDVMREITEKMDKWIAEVLQSDELFFVSRGCLPREVAEEMQAHRQRCMAIRDAKLAEMRRDLAEWWN